MKNLLAAVLVLVPLTTGCNKKKDEQPAAPSASAPQAAPAPTPANPTPATPVPPAEAAAAAKPAEPATGAAIPTPAAAEPGAHEDDKGATSYTPEQMTKCKKVMAAHVKCKSDAKYKAQIKEHFAYKPLFKDAFAGTDEKDCEMFLKPGEYLDADDNSRIMGSDLTDAKVLDALVTAAAGSCADLAKQFNVNDPVLGTPGFPFDGPEAL